MIIDSLTPVGFGGIPTVWEVLQCSAREKEAPKVHPEEVGTATAHPGACPARASLARPQVGRYTPNIHSVWETPWLFYTHDPNPCTSDPSNIVWADVACKHDWLALTGSPFLSWVIFSWLWNDKVFLLRSRYPSNLQVFSRSHLPGPWDSSRAGKRMKLSQPKTWERELSLRGNKASVWEELIGTVTWPSHLPLLFPIHASPF